MANKTSKQAGLLNAPAQDWSVPNLIKVLHGASTHTRADAVKLLKKQGILSPDGKLAKRYRSWGKRITHTPSVQQMLEA